MNCDCEMFTDMGGKPYVVDIESATKLNKDFRLALWTGKYLQLTLMCIPCGGEVGLEIHPETDQFFRVEQGCGVVEMGNDQDNLTFCRNITANDAILIPANTWRNIKNAGRCPLKMYSIYSPPHHPKGTVHHTKADAEMMG